MSLVRNSNLIFHFSIVPTFQYFNFPIFHSKRRLSMKRTVMNTMILAAFLLLFAFAQAYAQTDPLPSWNDGPAKKAIVEFVKRTTEKGSPKFGSDWQLRFQVQSLFPK